MSTNPNNKNPSQRTAQDQEQQLNAILQQTVGDAHYTDNEIGYLINPNTGTGRDSINSNLGKPSLKSNESGSQQRRARRYSSIEISKSFGSYADSQGQKLQDNNHLIQDEDGLMFIDSKQNSQQDFGILDDGTQADNNPFKHSNITPFPSIYAELDQYIAAMPLQIVQKKYPLFLLSKPNYQIPPPIHQNYIQFNQILQDKNIQMIDIGYKKSTQSFHVLIGFDQSIVGLYDLKSNRPIQLIQVFKKGEQNKSTSDNKQIMSVKWSENLQYFSVSNDFKEIKVFQIQQPVEIQGNIALKWLKHPIQVFTLSFPKIQTNIIDSHFIRQSPLKILLFDQDYEIYIVQMKKSFIHFKPFVQKFPIKFNDFLEIKTQKMCDQKGRIGTILIAGGYDYVTIAMIQPKFEIIMVYDKQKHCPEVKKKGYAQVQFLQDQTIQKSQQSRPNSSIKLLIGWDKYIQVMKLKVQAFQPFQYSIQTRLKYVFPQSSVSLGSLSDTLIYQLNRTCLKVYSLNQLRKYDIGKQKHLKLLQSQKVSSIQTNDKQIKNQNIQQLNTKDIEIIRKYAEPIFKYQISFSQLPYGDKIQQFIGNTFIPVEDVRFIKGMLAVANQNLFICYKNRIYEFKIQSFPQYIYNIIENINDWKLGLQLLNDGINSKITNFDGMKHKKLQKQLRQYSLRYIDFLRGIIPNPSIENDIWKQQMFFLLNILIQSNQQKFLIKDILMKLYRLSPQLLRVFEPFILMHQITKIQQSTLDLLYSVINKQSAKRLIYSMDTSKNLSVIQLSQQQQQDFNEVQLAHMINPILIRFQMYLEVIWANQFFGDYYTPFVILISLYEKTKSQKNLELEQQIQQISTKQKQKQQTLKSSELSVSKLSQLVGFLTYDILKKINQTPYHNKLIYFSALNPFYIPQTKAKYLIETLLPLFNEQLYKILLPNQSFNLFQNILQQLFQGNCLQILNYIDNHQNDKDFLSGIIQEIPYKEVLKYQCQDKYWLMILRFMVRKVIKMKVFNGIYYLTVDFDEKLTQKQKKKLKLVKIMDYFVRQCWSQLQQEFSLIQKQKKKQLFEKLSGSQYIQLLKLLGDQLSRQLQVLQSMIHSKAYHTIQIIQYIQQAINTSKDIQNKKQSKANLTKLKKILQQNIKLFTQIDPQQISTLIIKNYKQDMRQFIAYLDNTPKEQMLLLKQILLYYNYGQELNKQKIRFLELLAITNKSQIILNQLKNHMFPLDEAIEICQKYDIADALAFLLVKSGGSGNATRAIQLYFQLIQGRIQVYRLNRRTHERWVELKNYMLKELKQCIQVCIDLDLKGNFHYQTEWFFIIQQLQDLKKDIYRTCSPQVQECIKQIINECMYPILIRQLLVEVTQQNLVDYLNKSINQLEPQTVELIISQMVKSYFYEKQILKIAQENMISWERHQRSQIFKSILQGFVTTSRCYECMRIDVYTKIHYSCGHDIHPDCNHDMKECLSCRDDIEANYIRLIDQKERVEKITLTEEAHLKLGCKTIQILKAEIIRLKCKITLHYNLSIYLPQLLKCLHIQEIL